MVTALVLERSQFRSLAAGEGDAGALRVLTDGQFAKRSILLNRVLEQASGRSELADQPWFNELLTSLVRLEKIAPDAYRAALMWPHAGEWLDSCIQAMAATDDASVITHLRYLGNLLSAVYLEIDENIELPVAAIENAVCIPGKGSVVVPNDPTDPAIFRLSDGRAEIVFGSTSIPIGGGEEWMPIRELTAESCGRTMSLLLDDVDPFRGRHQMTPCARLTDDEASLWQGLFSEAWDCLVDRHSHRIATLADSMVCLVPTVPTVDGVGASATSVHAFGAVTMAVRRTGIDVALALVHEHQHGKLGALMDLVTLVNPDSGETFYAPWRSDPRPVIGLLQGVYAHLAVADFWRIEREQPTDLSTSAQIEFARWREQVGRALRVLRDSGQLTAMGEQLVRELTSTWSSWRSEHVPPGLAKAAAEVANAHEQAWIAEHASR